MESQRETDRQTRRKQETQKQGRHKEREKKQTKKPPIIHTSTQKITELGSQKDRMGGWRERKPIAYRGVYLPETEGERV